MKQIEYSYVGLKEPVVFKMKDITINQIRSIMYRLGISWEPEEGDETADYIKFLPRKDAQ